MPLFWGSRDQLVAASSLLAGLRFGAVAVLCIVWVSGCRPPDRSIEDQWREFLADPTPTTAANLDQRLSLVHDLLWSGKDADGRELAVPLGLPELVDAVIEANGSEDLLQWFDRSVRSLGPARRTKVSIDHTTVRAGTRVALRQSISLGERRTAEGVGEEQVVPAKWLFVPSRAPGFVEQLRLEEAGKPGFEARAWTVNGQTSRLKGSRLRVGTVGPPGLLFEIPDGTHRLELYYGDPAGVGLLMPLVAGPTQLPVWLGETRWSLFAQSTDGFSVRPGLRTAATVKVPSVVAESEEFALEVQFTDAFGNQAEGSHPAFEVVRSGQVVSKFGAGRGSSILIGNLRLSSSGVSRFRLATNDGLVAWSNPVWVEKTPPTHLFWGDFGAGSMSIGAGRPAGSADSGNAADTADTAHTANLDETDSLEGTAALRALERLARQRRLDFVGYAPWWGNLTGATAGELSALVASTGGTESPTVVPGVLRSGSIWLTTDLAELKNAARLASGVGRRGHSLGAQLWWGEAQARFVRFTEGLIASRQTVVATSAVLGGAWPGERLLPGGALTALWAETADSGSLRSAIEHDDTFATTGDRMLVRCFRPEGPRSARCSVFGTAPVARVRVIGGPGDPAKTLREEHPLEPRGQKGLLSLRWSVNGDVESASALEHFDLWHGTLRLTHGEFLSAVLFDRELSRRDSRGGEFSFEVISRNRGGALLEGVGLRNARLGVEITNHSLLVAANAEGQVVFDLGSLPERRKTDWGTIEAGWIKEEPTLDVELQWPELSAEEAGGALVVVEQVDGQVAVALFGASRAITNEE